MRKLLMLTLAAGAALGGAALAPTANAQPYSVYAAPGYRYDADGRRFVDYGYRDRGFYGDEPGYLGPVAVPYDRFGPDPNGLIAGDGHRIKCKLQNSYDDRSGRHVTRRICD